MKISIARCLAIAAVFALAACAQMKEKMPDWMPGSGATSVKLSGAEEVPPASTSGSGKGSFRIANDGSISLIDADGRTAVVGAGNIDLALSGNSRYLYELDGNRSISGFRIEADGHLTSAGRTVTLPASTVGLVAR